MNPELWGGIECTINRIGDTFRDQLQYSGHYTRTGDIEHIANLGIRSIRYPVLWERHQPVRNMPIDWSWATTQLDAIRQRNMTPIVGLVHHGGIVETKQMINDLAKRLVQRTGHSLFRVQPDTVDTVRPYGRDVHMNNGGRILFGSCLRGV